MSNAALHDLNDPAGYKAVFMAYGEAIRNFLFYKCGDLQLAEDLSQEAFIRLWSQRDKVDPNKVKSFLYTVANNLFLDHVRHQKVKLKFQQAQPKERTSESPEFLMEEQEFKERLEKAISDLPEGQREVFLMNRIEKLKYREIAELLNVSVKAVEKRMHKALRKLRTLTKKI